MKLEESKEIIKAFVNHNLSLGEDSSYASRLIPMLWSLPGEGKSTMVADLGKELDMDVSTVMVATFDAGELAGFPLVDKENNNYYRARPFFLPRKVKKPLILFLDELPQAPTSNQNIMAQLVNEGRLGEHKLPDNVSIVCAGNPMTSRAGTSMMPSHLKDRLTHLNIETDHKGFVSYALEKGFCSEITSYINNRPEWLQKFKPDVDACPTPRSWERANHIMSLDIPVKYQNLALSGQLGEAATTDFLGYLKIVRSNAPKIEDILLSPETINIPEDSMVLYSLMSGLAYHADNTTLKSIVIYISRVDNREFAAFCIREILKRNYSLKSNKHLSGWIIKVGKDIML